MWRPAHGATSRPGPSRPASGYGRALGRPGPRDQGPVEVDGSPVVLDPATFVVLMELSELVERGVEVAAPVRP